MFNTYEIAKEVAYAINEDDIHQIPFPVFLDKYRLTIDAAIKAKFRPGQRKPVHLVARQLHAIDVKRAINAGKTIPVTVLTYHQYTPGLFNAIWKLASQGKVNLEY